MTMVAGCVRLRGDARDDVVMVRRMLARMSTGVPVVISSEGAHLGLSGNVAGNHPLVRHASGLVLTWDGRLDVSPDQARPDADVVADALVSDPRAVAGLVGDFALAAWFPRDRRLCLARDIVGLRPLYYASTPDVFWWASSLAGVLAPEWLPRDLNEGYFAEYLASAPVSLTETPVRNVWRVPQAHTLELSDGAIRLTRYWHPEVTAERRLSVGEATEAFTACFQDAVRSRVRTRTTPCFQLSGGLDSSSVVGTARRLGVVAPATYSMVFPDWPAADETPFITEAEAHHGCVGTHLAHEVSRVEGWSVFAPAVRAGDLPEGATGEHMMAPLMARAASDGHSAMLTGIGGDDWLTGSLFRSTDLLRQWRPLAAWRHARDYRSIVWLDSGWRNLVWHAVVPLLPEVVKAWGRRGRGGMVLPWVRPDFAARVSLSERMRAGGLREPPVSRGGSHVVRESLVRLQSGDSAHVREALHRMGRRWGIELRHPFLDRRVIEFLLTLPDDLRFRDRQHRYLLRQAMGPLLPPRVGARLDKPDFNDLVVDGVLAADPAAALRETLQVVERGWITPAALQTLWWDVQRGTPADLSTGYWAPLVLWQVLGAEAAARALSSGAPDVPAV
jgi:asparagine synthase (glutamine-hydrolysing)